GKPIVARAGVSIDPDSVDGSRRQDLRRDCRIENLPVRPASASRTRDVRFRALLLGRAAAMAMRADRALFWSQPRRRRNAARRILEQRAQLHFHTAFSALDRPCARTRQAAPLVGAAALFSAHRALPAAACRAELDIYLRCSRQAARQAVQSLSMADRRLRGGAAGESLLVTARACVHQAQPGKPAG